MRTPVALIIFKRPDTTKKVFEAIRQAKPPILLVVADGPRADRPGEAEQCIATRAVVEKIDWDCEVLRNYSDTNLGCGLRPATGISWVFDQVEEAIILEDDCLPHPSFFQFCEELLEKYRNDTRIMNISGNNFLYGQKRTDYSYYFSRYPHIWGWATWRRAWQYFDFEVKLWNQVRDGSWLTDCFNDESYARFWGIQFEKVYGKDKSHIWDYQWTFSCLVQNGLSINPCVNLVSNIGYGEGATHTIANVTDPRSNLPAEEIAFPLLHPPFIIRDAIADNFTQNTVFNYHQSLIKRARNRIKKVLNIY